MAEVSLERPVEDATAPDDLDASPVDKLVMIIRHAEKPLPDRPDAGVTELGEEDDKSLTVRGWQRAGALACLFCSPPTPLHIPKSIVASAPVKQDGSGTRNLRPTQTISPLALRLQIEPDTRFSKGQVDLAGPLIAMQGSPTLVCWQHESIPRLAAAIVKRGGVAPRLWDHEDYDSIWMLGYSASSARWVFMRARQGLLLGDKR
ncbi:hypothetical protein [Mesorhizobium sp. L-2-11]|uniref:hypothetical protein n=1 Tax=Mesorhizobium sp. L-2-11 TaxID=2744521 RepID=UPI001925EE51|nr:hypothetical protein [Mesorhizobium sp. L-2-11]BCH19669.1 hypothetical protein MesoLjLa_65200 [Mesorhizobium sp. L-2-11]